MAKRKGRAARKHQRKRVQRAKERGLPQALEEAKPAKTRKVKGDTVAAAVASEREGRAKVERKSAEPAPAVGMPVFAKVLIGAALALVVVYALSQLRKSDEPGASPDVESAREADSESSMTDVAPAAEEEAEAPAQPASGETSLDGPGDLDGAEPDTQEEAPRTSAVVPTPKSNPEPAAVAPAPTSAPARKPPANPSPASPRPTPPPVPAPAPKSGAPTKSAAPAIADPSAARGDKATGVPNPAPEAPSAPPSE